MKEMTKDQQDSWLAALIDGEGSISVVSNNTSPVLVMINIANTHLPLLELVKSITSVGNINASHSPKETKPCYSWRVAAKVDVVYILDRVLPYLVIKETKAKVARALVDTVGTHGKKTDDRTLVLRSDLLDIWDQLKD